MPRVFLDMDGVIVDFDAYRRQLQAELDAKVAACPGEYAGLNGAPLITGDDIKRMPNAYESMPPIDGAIAGVRSLIGMGFDVWLATKPPTGIAHAYAGKAAWVFKYLPELSRKLILTHDKGLLGCGSDFLVDDRPHRANCCEFPGAIIGFGPNVRPHHAVDYQAADWPDLLMVLRAAASMINERRRAP